VGRLTPVGASQGVRLAAERLAATVLDAFDSHRWAMFDLPFPRWVCTRCWLPMEATTGRHCDAQEGVSME